MTLFGLFDKTTTTNEEKPVNDNRSSGFHVFEIHMPSIGIGAVILGIIILAIAILWFLAARYRANSRRASRNPWTRYPAPFPFDSPVFGGGSPNVIHDLQLQKILRSYQPPHLSDIRLQLDPRNQVVKYTPPATAHVDYSDL